MTPRLPSHAESQAFAPCFVVSTGRCGSSTLLRALGSHPHLLGISEFFASLLPDRALASSSLDARALMDLLSCPAPGTSDLVAGGIIPEILCPVESWSGGPLKLATLPALTSDVDALHEELCAAAASLDESDTASAYSRLFAWLCLRFARRAWVEKSGASLGYVDRLLQLWPSARFIHLFRDGPECAYSMSRHPYFRVLVARAVARCPGLDVNACLKGDLPLERFGAYWSAVMLRGTRAMARSHSQILHVDFDRLIASPSEELKHIAAFLQLDPWSEWIAAATRNVESGRRAKADIDEDIRALLKPYCEPGRRAILETSKLAWSGRAA